MYEASGAHLVLSPPILALSIAIQSTEVATSAIKEAIPNS
jgi:hypothetical protein